MGPSLVLSLLALSASGSSISGRSYDRSVDLIDRLYLYPETVNAASLMHASARGLSEELDWLMVQPDGAVVHLAHGNGTAIGSVSVATMDTLPEALRALEVLVLESGFDVGDVDVRLELLKGLSDGLDRYSRVLAGEKLERFDVRLKGTLVGVGATLRLVDSDRLVVKSLVEDGPADRGGLLVGDVVARIDGVSTINMPLREATRRIRGEEATPIILSVDRLGLPIDIPLVREEVVVPNVEHRALADNVGYIQIDHFSQRTVENLVASIEGLRSLDAMSVGLVIDLRGNTGGSMREAARSADQFLTEGLLLRTAGPDGRRVQNLQARMDAIDAGDEPPIPVVILVDDRTASGSEILAGALYEGDRAVLVGTRTYGKGTVQKIYKLDEGARLKLTVAEYLLANDRKIAGAGLVPDVVLAAVEFDDYSVRYRGWSEQRTGVPWEEILPVVMDRDNGRDDVALELARRTILEAKGTTRGAVLAALERVAPTVRAEQEAALAFALQRRSIDWSEAEAQVSEPSALVWVAAYPDAENPDVITLAAEVENLGELPLSRTLVELECQTFSAWDGLVVPVGRVAPGERVEDQISVPLRPGIDPREDEVVVHMRAQNRAVMQVGAEVLHAESTPDPKFSVTSRLVRRQDQQHVALTIRNLSGVNVNGMEVYFASPGDLDVELVDRASRLSLVEAGGEGHFDLEVRVGDSVPDHLPLNLVVEGEPFGQLIDWVIHVPTDGAEVIYEEPRIVGRVPLHAEIGRLGLPLRVTDDRGLDHLVVYANGEKVAWAAGGSKEIELKVAVDLGPGNNRVVAVAEDDQGLVTRVQFNIRGEAHAAVDAGDTER